MAITGNPGDLATGGFGTGVRGVAATPRDVANAVSRGQAMAAAREIGQGRNRDVGTGFRGPTSTWGSAPSVVSGSLVGRAAVPALSPYRNAFDVTQDELVKAAIANAPLMSGGPMNPSLFELQALATQVQADPTLAAVASSIYTPFMKDIPASVPAGILDAAINNALPMPGDFNTSPAPELTQPQDTSLLGPDDFRAPPQQQVPTSAEIDPFSMSNLLAGANDVMQYTSPVAQGIVQDLPGALRSAGTRLHAGVDFNSPTGTPVTPSMPGTVVQVGNASGYGPFVDIQDINGQIQRYAVHNTGSVNVRTGDYVAPGDVIGTVGAQAPGMFEHLHFENISPQDAAYNEIMAKYEQNLPGFAGRTSSPSNGPIRSSTQSLIDQMGLTTGTDVASMLPRTPYTLLGGRPTEVASADVPEIAVTDDMLPTVPTEDPARVIPVMKAAYQPNPFDNPVQVPRITPSPSPEPETDVAMDLPPGILSPAYMQRALVPTDIIPRPGPASRVPVINTADASTVTAPSAPSLPPRTPTPSTLARLYSQFTGQPLYQTASLLEGQPNTSRYGNERQQLASTLLASAQPTAPARERDREKEKEPEVEQKPVPAQPVQLSKTILPDWYWEWYKSRGLTGGLLG